MHVAIQQEPSARAALCKRQRSSWQSYSCRADGQHETSAQDKASIGKFNASLDIQGQACVRGAIPWTVDWPYLSAQERTMDRLAGQSRPRSKRPISSTRRRKACTTPRRHRVPHAMAKMLRCTMMMKSLLETIPLPKAKDIESLMRSAGFDTRRFTISVSRCADTGHPIVTIMPIAFVGEIEVTISVSGTP